MNNKGILRMHKDQQPLVREESFWTSSFCLYLLLLFGIPLSLATYWTGLDAYIAAHAYTFWQLPWLQKLSAHLSTFGSAGTQCIVCFVVAAIYYRRKMYDWTRLWLYSIVVYLGVGVCAVFLKAILGRPRPKLMGTMYDFQWFELGARLHSYPSGHTITTFAWLACLLPFYGAKTRFLMFVIATVVSLGRVSITSHFLGDVIFGAVISYVLATLWMRKKGLGAVKPAPFNVLERKLFNIFSPLWFSVFGKIHK